jgi:Zn-finger nucleic acid-binding protein
MKCPIDGETLIMTERHGVEIDYCPRCRGVWLDRGELDKIIDKAAGAMALPDPDPAPQPAPQAAPDPRVWQEPYREAPRSKGKRYEGRYSKPRKRKSILSEIFDFD